MFLRKLVVLLLPIIFVAALCIVFPLFGSLGFLSNVIRGLLLGCALNLMLPLCGATRRREPFSGMLIIPAIFLLLVIAFQYVTSMNFFSVPFLSFLSATNGQTVLVESTFLGFLLAQTFRTKR